MGKSRAAAFALGIEDIDEGAHVNTFSETADDSDSFENPLAEGFVFCSLGHLVHSTSFAFFIKVGLASGKSLIVHYT